MARPSIKPSVTPGFPSPYALDFGEHRFYILELVPTTKTRYHRTVVAGFLFCGYSRTRRGFAALQWRVSEHEASERRRPGPSGGATDVTTSACLNLSWLRIINFIKLYTDSPYPL